MADSRPEIKNRLTDTAQPPELQIELNKQNTKSNRIEL